jgi:hypothetical protein
LKFGPVTIAMTPLSSWRVRTEKVGSSIEMNMPSGAESGGIRAARQTWVIG